MTLAERCDAFQRAFADRPTVGRILVQRSTNHRARVLSLFERVA